MKFRYRLIADVSAEIEWLYLASETYYGEQCIVPLLRELVAETEDVLGLRAVLARQIDEELDHIRRYEALLGGSPCEPSGYHLRFAAYVRTLKHPIEKLFALQALLEGQSLGAVTYRLGALSESPSEATDHVVLRDEEGHTRFGLAFLKTLADRQGPAPSIADLKRISRDVNAIFSAHFKGIVVARIASAASGRRVDEGAIEASPAMRHFRKQAAGLVVTTRAEFLQRYAKALA